MPCLCDKKSASCPEYIALWKRLNPAIIRNYPICQLLLWI